MQYNFRKNHHHWMHAITVLLLALTRHATCFIDLFLDSNETSSLLGFSNTFFYIFNGELRQNSISYRLDVPENKPAIELNWRIKGPPDYLSIRYNLSLCDLKDTNTDKSNNCSSLSFLSINGTGLVPTKLSQFQILFDCTKQQRRRHRRGFTTVQMDLSFKPLPFKSSSDSGSKSGKKQQQLMPLNVNGLKFAVKFRKYCPTSSSSSSPANNFNDEHDDDDDVDDDNDDEPSIEPSSSSSSGSFVIAYITLATLLGFALLIVCMASTMYVNKRALKRKRRHLSSRLNLSGHVIQPTSNGNKPNLMVNATKAEIAAVGIAGTPGAVESLLSSSSLKKSHHNHNRYHQNNHHHHQIKSDSNDECGANNLQHDSDNQLICSSSSNNNNNRHHHRRGSSTSSHHHNNHKSHHQNQQNSNPNYNQNNSDHHQPKQQSFVKNNLKMIKRRQEQQQYQQQNQHQQHHQYPSQYDQATDNHQNLNHQDQDANLNLYESLHENNTPQVHAKHPHHQNHQHQQNQESRHNQNQYHPQQQHQQKPEASLLLQETTTTTNTNPNPIQSRSRRRNNHMLNMTTATIQSTMTVAAASAAANNNNTLNAQRSSTRLALSGAGTLSGSSRNLALCHRLKRTRLTLGHEVKILKLEKNDDESGSTNNKNAARIFEGTLKRRCRKEATDATSIATTMTNMTTTTSGFEEVKVFVKQMTLSQNNEECERMLQEACLLRGLKHKNVHAILGVIDDQEVAEDQDHLVESGKRKEVLAVFNYCELGNLKLFLTNIRIKNLDTKQNLQMPMCAAQKPEGEAPAGPENDNNRMISVQEILYITMQLLKGVNYLHGKHVVHTDIAARNCWLDVNYTLKIGDYAMSRHLFPDDYSSARITREVQPKFKIEDEDDDDDDNENENKKEEPEKPKQLVSAEKLLPIGWMAVETLESLQEPGTRQTEWNTKTDVWSLGVTVWECFELCGRQPYENVLSPPKQGDNKADEKLVYEYLNKKGNDSDDGDESTSCRLARPASCPVEIYEQACSKSWSRDPDVRPTLKEIFHALHNFYTNLNNYV